MTTFAELNRELLDVKQQLEDVRRELHNANSTIGTHENTIIENNKEITRLNAAVESRDVRLRYADEQISRLSDGLFMKFLEKMVTVSKTPMDAYLFAQETLELVLERPNAAEIREKQHEEKIKSKMAPTPAKKRNSGG